MSVPGTRSTRTRFAATARRGSCSCTAAAIWAISGRIISGFARQCWRSFATGQDNRTIVQLPQSIHFRAGEGLDRFAACVAAHPDFHLYVRDAQSLALAQRLSCPVALAPDSAFALGAQPRGPADCDLLMLMRTDDERVAGDRGPVPKGAVVLDWLEDGVLPAWEAGVPRPANYERLARARVARGLTLLSRGRQIVTDRLHAHILALLLGIPHVALDNEYGKLSAYIAAWTAPSPLLLRE
jgi:exopolysaccharide biosynthesis predicted pyruvyltransferase EpsI